MPRFTFDHLRGNMSRNWKRSNRGFYRDVLAPPSSFFRASARPGPYRFFGAGRSSLFGHGPALFIRPCAPAFPGRARPNSDLVCFQWQGGPLRTPVIHLERLARVPDSRRADRPASAPKGTGHQLLFFRDPTVSCLEFISLSPRGWRCAPVTDRIRPSPPQTAGHSPKRRRQTSSANGWSLRGPHATGQTPRAPMSSRNPSAQTILGAEISVGRTDGQIHPSSNKSLSGQETRPASPNVHAGTRPPCAPLRSRPDVDVVTPR